MAPWEFTRKYCQNCGSLLCRGIDDEEWRETCICYQKEFFGSEESVNEADQSTYYKKSM